MLTALDTRRARVAHALYLLGFEEPYPGVPPEPRGNRQQRRAMQRDIDRFGRALAKHERMLVEQGVMVWAEDRILVLSPASERAVASEQPAP